MAITLYGNKQNIIQAVTLPFTTTFTSSGTSGAQNITGFSATITPSSSSNKILILVSATLGTSGNTSVGMCLTRNGTQIALGDLNGVRQQMTTKGGTSSGAFWTVSQSMNFIDSPATTSAVTYQVQVNSNGYTTYCNRSATSNNDTSPDAASPMSCITLLEVAYA